MSKGPVVFILTAKNCGGCLKFKGVTDERYKKQEKEDIENGKHPLPYLLGGELDKTLEYLKTQVDDKVLGAIKWRDVAAIGMPVADDEQKFKPNPDIDRWVGFYPSIMIFSYNSWNNHNVPLEGYVMGGKWEKKKSKDANGKIVTKSVMTYNPGSFSQEDPNILSHGDIKNWVRSMLTAFNEIPVTSASSAPSISNYNGEIKTAGFIIRFDNGGASSDDEDGYISDCSYTNVEEYVS